MATEMTTEDRRKVNVLIYRGKGRHSAYLYGTITDAETGNLMTSASAKYVTEAIKDGNYRIVNLEVEE